MEEQWLITKSSVIEPNIQNRYEFFNQEIAAAMRMAQLCERYSLSNTFWKSADQYVCVGYLDDPLLSAFITVRKLKYTD